MYLHPSSALRTYLLEHQAYLEHILLPTVFINNPDHLNKKNSNNVEQQNYKEIGCNQTVIRHYTHEKRLQTTKKLIHQLWDVIFNHTSIENTTLIVGHRNKRNTKEELVYQTTTLLQ